MNTTYLGKNNLKVTANGSVLALGKGRRTITTANAFQKMVKPANGGLSCWNDFVRVYTPDLSTLSYSSLLVGQWDTLTQQGGDNVRLFGSFKTRNGVIVVGHHTGNGDQMPLANVPAWGTSAYNGTSAVLAYLQAAELVDPNDDPTDLSTAIDLPRQEQGLSLFPNPASESFLITAPSAIRVLRLLDAQGRTVLSQQNISSGTILLGIGGLEPGCYAALCEFADGHSAMTRMIIER